MPKLEKIFKLEPIWNPQGIKIPSCWGIPYCGVWQIKFTHGGRVYNFKSPIPGDFGRELVKVECRNWCRLHEDSDTDLEIFHCVSSDGIGMLITPIGFYGEYYKIRVDFETGYSEMHRWHIMELADSECSINFTKSCIHPKNWSYGTIIVNQPAYRFHDECNFFCHCTRCGLKAILTLDEMAIHNNSCAKRFKEIL